MHRAFKPREREVKTTTIWKRVYAVIDGAPSLTDLRAHGLHLLAAHRWRSLGKSVPSDLAEDELEAAFRTLAVPAVLGHVREACDGPIVVMKGPVVAARYPDPALRPFQDLDLLVPDAQVAQESLLAAGFKPVGDPKVYGHVRHHLRPLRSPKVPLHVELHSRPKWVEGLEPPSLDLLLAEAEAAALGVDGILTFAPSHHVLVLAAHMWAHDPLIALLHVLDVAVMAEGSERRELDLLAQAWGIGRLWRTTIGVADAIFLGETRRPWPLGLWARGLTAAREPTVFEMHLGRCLGPFWVLPPRRAPRAFAVALGGLLRRQADESWRAKLERTRRELTHPSMRSSERRRSLAFERKPAKRATDVSRPFGRRKLR